MRRRRWVRRVLVMTLTLGVLGLAGHFGAERLVRARGEASAASDGGWGDGPWCLSPTRPYLCLLEYRFRLGGLGDWFAELGLPSNPPEIPPSE